MKNMKINKQLLPMKAHYFLFNAGTGPVVPYLTSYARQIGLSSVVVGFVYTILPIAGMLAKPIFGTIADRFRCQKPIFLTAIILTAAAFLAVFYSPKSETERRVHFSCHYNVPAFNTYFSNNLDECSIQNIQENNSVGHCKMNCDMNNNFSNILCHDWDIKEYCDPSNIVKPFTFSSDIPKAKIDKFDDILVFLMDNITLQNGTVIFPKKCPGNDSISTSCLVDCDDYTIDSIIVQPTIDDKNVYDSYQFWFFLLFMVLAWIGQALSVSIGDAICFEMLGDKPNRYGYQRMFGSLGWGIFSAVTGILIDLLSQGKSEKDYTSAFYISAVFLFLDFIISSRITFKQTKISSNIFQDVGRLLMDIRIVVYLIWCIAVGMCTGLIWQFLFWLIEDVAKSQGCDSQNYVKTLQGIVQAIQCLAGEMPFFFLSGWILKRIGHIHTMSLVLFGLGCRLVLHSFITNPWVFLPVELLHGLTFGLFFACMASYASIVAPPGTEATMQGFVGAVFEGLGVSAGSSLAGISYEKYGGSLTFRYFGVGAFTLGLVHVVVQYILKIRDTKVKYAPPQVVMEKVHEDDQQELTFVDG